MLIKGCYILGSDITGEISVLFHKENHNLGVMYDGKGNVMEIVFAYEKSKGEIKEVHVQPE